MKNGTMMMTIMNTAKKFPIRITSMFQVLKSEYGEIPLSAAMRP